MREGHYSFEAAYEFPTYIRRYLIQKISEENRERAEKMEEAKTGRKTLVDRSLPDIKKMPPPTKHYTSKAGKK